jgi:general nucleoside transport system permease protein
VTDERPTGERNPESTVTDEAPPGDAAEAVGGDLAGDDGGGAFTPAAAEESVWRALLIPALAMVTALAVGAIVIMFSDPDVLRAWGRFFQDPLGALREAGISVAEAYQALFTGAFGSPTQIVQAIASGEGQQILVALRPLSETITTATPLILAGLSVALGFRAGLFNIGAEGQITVGAMFAGVVGFTFTGLPMIIHLPLALVAGFVGGAVWGFVPGFLKARTGAHEVIITIMMNFISFRLLDYALRGDFFQRPDRADPISKPVAESAELPRLLGSGLRVHAGIILAIAVTLVVGWLLFRTTRGFEFRAVGANPDASRYAGMSVGLTYIAAMSIAGGLAGLAGANQLLGVTKSLTVGFSSGIGFVAIALALLGRAHPAGVVAAAFLFGALQAGAIRMQAVTQTPVDIIVVIQALVIAFVAAPALVRAIYRIKAKRQVGPEVFTKGWSG